MRERREWSPGDPIYPPHAGLAITQEMFEVKEFDLDGVDFEAGARWTPDDGWTFP